MQKLLKLSTTDLFLKLKEYEAFVEQLHEEVVKRAKAEYDPTKKVQSFGFTYIPGGMIMDREKALALIGAKYGKATPKITKEETDWVKVEELIKSTGDEVPMKPKADSVKPFPKKKEASE